MKSETSQSTICPCCGNENAREAEICQICHARRIDEPLVQPENKLPSLGPAFMAAGAVALVLIGFLGAWVLSNDMKVLRVFLVSLLGESTLFTRALLQGDPDLLRYRIFTFDAYRLASILSVILAPLSICGLWLARRARRLASEAPRQFGGQRVATVSMLVSLVLFVTFSAAGISSIPRAIQNGRAKRIAETRSRFYHLHVQVLTKYYAENGTYPQELSDLREFVPEPIPQADYWGHLISYTPTALIASKKSAPVFSNYQLISPGPDGIFDTADDIRMIDGVIVSAPDDTDPITGFLPSGNKQ